MNVPESLREALRYRGMAMGAFLGGAVLVGIGVVLGLQAFVSALVADPLNPTEALEEASPLITIAFTLLGFVVWRVGKTYALFVTLPEAAGRSAAEQFDTERVKSELLEALDGRIEELEVEVEQTRRRVEQLQRAEHAAAFDEDELLDSAGEDARGEPSTGSRSESASRPAGSSVDADSSRSTTDSRSASSGASSRPSQSSATTSSSDRAGPGSETNPRSPSDTGPADETRESDDESDPLS